MQCPKCKKEMVNKGNVSCIVYTTHPVQWDDVYVCDDCQTKKTVRVFGVDIVPNDYSMFTEI